MRTYADPPVAFVRGKGSELFDSEGRRYLDFVSGIAVTSLGHAHPDVVAALTSQAETLWHVSNLFGNELATGVAATLNRLIGGGKARGNVFFCNSGAEANECAFKLARRAGAPGRYVVVGTTGSFHGRTLATLAATGQPEKHARFVPMPEGFAHVPYDDLDAAADALADPAAAAFVVEAVQGEGGVRVPSGGYLAGLRQICDELGVLLICDEVQTGLGRTGAWFAFQHEGVLPDVVTMAKALGNGLPVGACWANEETAAAFEPGDHATTFGGQPLAMAAVASTLAVMEREDVCERARRAGERLRNGLADLPGVAEVRGLGLLLGVQLSDVAAKDVVAAALGAGLLLNAVQADTVRLAPSLLITDALLDEALDLFAQALGSARGCG